MSASAGSAGLRTTVLLMSVDEAELLATSLPAAVAQEGADVVVVDNASRDETAQLTRRHGAHYMRLDSRRSYCAAMNHAIAATGGDAVLLLNADCFLEPGFLTAARPRLAEPGVGSVAPKLLRAGRHGEELAQIDTIGMVIDRRRKNNLVGHGRPVSAYDTPSEVFGADGAAALYRREVLEACAVDGEVFDVDFEMWASDADLAWRARLLGWRCVYEPGAVAHHVRTYSPSTRAHMPERDRRLQFRNRLLMMAKNETALGFAGGWPWILGYEALAAGHALVRERHLLQGYREAWELLPAARRRRRRVQSMRARRARPPFGLEAPV